MTDQGTRRNPSRIRRAREDEAAAISDLALRSKAMWGYPPAFVEACRAALTLTEEEIRQTPVYVHDGDTGVDGFYGLAGRPPRATLEYLFVDPVATRRGIGTKLLRHAVAVACRLGFERIEVESDPNAEPFYERNGGVRIGEVESSVEAGRKLPLLLIDLR
ncbi:MAG TPA: GNAT family N-acetyltransferase [Actinomycetota bacterium]|nr:GNAT family N-acetyltransferase [Actinomycetota bacterium]